MHWRLIAISILVFYKCVQGVNRSLFGTGDDVLVSYQYKSSTYRPVYLKNGYAGVLIGEKNWFLYDDNGHKLVDGVRVDFPANIVIRHFYMATGKTVQVIYKSLSGIKGLYYLQMNLWGQVVTPPKVITRLYSTSSWNFVDKDTLPNGNVCMIYNSPNFGITFDKNGKLVGAEVISLSGKQTLRIKSLSNNGVVVLGTHYYYNVYNSNFQIIKSGRWSTNSNYYAKIISVNNIFMVIVWGGYVIFFKNDGTHIITVKDINNKSLNPRYISNIVPVSNTQFQVVSTTQTGTFVYKAKDSTHYTLTVSSSIKYKYYDRIYDNKYFHFWYESQLKENYFYRLDVTNEELPLKLDTPQPNTRADYSYIGAPPPTQRPSPMPTLRPTMRPARVPTRYHYNMPTIQPTNNGTNTDNTFSFAGLDEVISIIIVCAIVLVGLCILHDLMKRFKHFSIEAVCYQNSFCNCFNVTNEALPANDSKKGKTHSQK